MHTSTASQNDRGTAPVRIRPSLHQPGLLILDMDSTLIQCECIDELAIHAGIGTTVSALNARAMRGELEFSESLLACMPMLAGISEKSLEYVYAERVKLTNGVTLLVQTLHAYGWKVGIISGGFSYFADRLMQRTGMDFAYANELEMKDNKLSGRLLGDLINAEKKASLLIELAAQYGIPMHQTVAVGDGANDLPMLKAAALGIAFYAKDMVRSAVMDHIDEGGLERVLDLLDE